ncbi:extracellular solute-binding protein [Burkholderia vietnamiensis]|uniref:extracellular solute-binding protein n=1 Tax=Burkholderia vietnamiensis TaxID=60552 RepID=UPI001CF4797A|nr:extracellular solute-binding protein [Burkholderia vietnamiensis]MCA8195320.1 extracellular solute-binding protein [Burkholderia vietnamiensis]MDN8111585.1 extracellular solute-binding protein [Burkholderia vietnamiensis]WHU95275.1 extracellular solute-binding protein [Burkholderia vietnamiensis]
MNAFAPSAAEAANAISQYDQPKYSANFTHFDYADPDAPNDGTLNFENYDTAQSYDSLNPFLTRGSPAPDIKNLMFDTLMQRSWDELASEYALIADDVEVASDGLSATFHINPAARFSNGDAITAADVKYSLDTLASPQASPIYNAQFSIIKRAVVVDSHTIRFEFKHAERDAALIAGDLPVFSPKWGQRADGTRPPFDQIANVPPIASGAYLIEQRRNDKQIAYVRNPHYWAANLPSRRGMFRFARVSFKLYLDQYTALEAFKAGDVDARMEYSSTQWARKYVGKNFRNGLLKKGEFPDGPAQMQGFMMNLRKPMFRDVRVRHALALAFDFDWMSRMMFYGQYRRTNSFWEASPFAASGMPSAKELALLEPYRSTLPAEVFGPMIKQPSTLPPGSLRANLRQARDLLAQAGWHYRDGALRDANGTPMTIEIIDDQPGMDRLILPYTQALETLGIHAYLHELDSALYQKRLDNFEYDMTTYIYLPVTIPGAELTRRFGSEAASQPGSENYPGVKSKAVDALIRAALTASTLDDLETAVHALDRVLINLYVLVPQYYLPNARIAYKTALGHPPVVPASYQYEDWIIDYWYVKRPAAQPAPAA